MPDGSSLEDHFQDMSHLRDQFAAVDMAIDDATFIKLFLRTLTVFYTDALPALLTATDLAVEKIFSAAMWPSKGLRPLMSAARKKPGGRL
ncbi:hypothetical protein V1525DRAFT_390865 [Lipomyces kononenkoae]|uniref:Uncharacterized protein n=1 Tax=Lipomyces kononenkoae TaxID=34357 RepID=A0ACC3STT4_LIPKO